MNHRKKANKIGTQNKVLLLAYTNKNFGDDMFVKTICTVLPDHLFYLEASKEYRNIFASVTNLKIVTPSVGYRILRKLCSMLHMSSWMNTFRHIWLRKFRAVVYVIGGLFDEDDLWKNQIQKYGLEEYKQIMLMHSYYEDIPFYLLGSNMTRIKTKEYIDVMTNIFSGLKDICFRDKYSYTAFQHLPNVRYAPDIVFNYPVMNQTKNNDIVISVWGVLLRCDIMPQWKWAEGFWNGYENFLCKTIEYFLNNNYNIKLLSLCENEGDLLACNKVAEKYTSDKIDIVNYNGNLDQIVDMFEKARFVIGTRFHSVVLSYSTRTNVYPIVYESKTLELLHDIDYDNEYSDISEIDETHLERVIKVFENVDGFDCSRTKEKAKEQFKILSKQLNGED